MKFIITSHLVLSLISFAVVYSSEAPSMTSDWNQTQLERNIDTLQHNVQMLQSQVSVNYSSIDSGNETTGACQDKSDLDRLIPQALSRGQSLIRKTSSFAGLKRLLRIPLGRRRYRKRVSVSTLASSLSLTSSQFAAWSVRASQSGERTGSENNSVTAELWKLIEGVASLSATLVNETSTLLLQQQDSSIGATAGLAASSVIAVLGFLERVTLATASVAIDYTNVLANISQSADLESLSIKISQLQNALAVGSGSGALDGVVSFQTDQGDAYGLAASLSKIAMNMSFVGQSLSRFVAEADATNAAPSGMIKFPSVELEPIISLGELAEVIYLTTGMISTILTSVVDIALEVPTVTGRILGSSLGMVVGSIGATFNGIVTTFTAIVRTLQTDTNVSGDTLLIFLCNINNGNASLCNTIILLRSLLLSPIGILFLFAWLLAAAICNALASSNSRLFCQKSERILTSCPMVSLRCENNLLSDNLPIV